MDVSPAMGRQKLRWRLHIRLYLPCLPHTKIPTNEVLALVVILQVIVFVAVTDDVTWAWSDSLLNIDSGLEVRKALPLSLILGFVDKL